MVPHFRTPFFVFFSRICPSPCFDSWLTDLRLHGRRLWTSKTFGQAIALLPHTFRPQTARPGCFPFSLRHFVHMGDRRMAWTFGQTRTKNAITFCSCSGGVKHGGQAHKREWVWGGVEIFDFMTSKWQVKLCSTGAEWQVCRVVNHAGCSTQSTAKNCPSPNAAIRVAVQTAPCFPAHCECKLNINVVSAGTHCRLRRAQLPRTR